MTDPFPWATETGVSASLFFRQAAAAPSDHGPWLVAADWLEEQGFDVRGFLTRCAQEINRFRNPVHPLLEAACADPFATGPLEALELYCARHPRDDGAAAGFRRRIDTWNPNRRHTPSYFVARPPSYSDLADAILVYREPSQPDSAESWVAEIPVGNVRATIHRAQSPQEALFAVIHRVAIDYPQALPSLNTRPVLRTAARVVDLPSPPQWGRFEGDGLD